MNCANCGNDDQEWLCDEGDTVYCQKCYHRTLLSTGELDEIECKYCHNMRDRTAYYCQHCNMPQ